MTDTITKPEAPAAFTLPGWDDAAPAPKKPTKSARPAKAVRPVKVGKAAPAAAPAAPAAEAEAAAPAEAAAALVVAEPTDEDAVAAAAADAEVAADEEAEALAAPAAAAPAAAVSVAESGSYVELTYEEKVARSELPTEAIDISTLTQPPHGGARATGIFGEVVAALRRRGALVASVAAVFAVAGTLGVVLTLTAAGKVVYAEALDDTIRVEATADVAGPDGHEDVETNAGVMTVEAMEPLHYFIPALGVYSQIVPTNDFVATRYGAFKGLDVPSDPSKTGWFSDGGALASNEPGSTGTTLLASHVAYNGKWGVLREMHSLTGGELIYVKDADGVLSAWKLVELHSLQHTEFPRNYWAADGVRRLVIATCGDFDARKGFYTKNIFAVATPVDPATGQPMPESGLDSDPESEHIPDDGGEVVEASD